MNIYDRLRDSVTLQVDNVTITGVLYRTKIPLPLDSKKSSPLVEETTEYQYVLKSSGHFSGSISSLTIFFTHIPATSKSTREAFHSHLFSILTCCFISLYPSFQHSLSSLSLQPSLSTSSLSDSYLSIDSLPTRYFFYFLIPFISINTHFLFWMIMCLLNITLIKTRKTHCFE
jgi:hypothetical protein